MCIFDFYLVILLSKCCLFVAFLVIDTDARQISTKGLILSDRWDQSLNVTVI